MNTDKAGKLLRKIQALYENLSDQGTMSGLERDLILSYLRELYEDISSQGTSTNSGFQRHTVKSPPPAVHESPVRHELAPKQEPPRQETPPPPQPPTVEPPPPVYSTPVERPVEPQSPPVYHQPKPEPVPEPPKPTYEAPAEPVSSSISTSQQTEDFRMPSPAIEHDSKRMPSGENGEALAALFEFKRIGELSEKLQLQPLDRLEQGMGINERILMINELFKGDGILFMRTVKDLDVMRSFEEARQYLMGGVARDFDWANKERRDQAIQFVQLVRRRFLPV